MGEMNIERWERINWAENLRKNFDKANAEIQFGKPEVVGLIEIDWEAWKQWRKENGQWGK
jgi:uncharacterized protein YjdB